MSIPELTQRLTEIARAMGWAISPVIEGTSTVVGFTIAAPDVLATRFPNADVWAPREDA